MRVEAVRQRRCHAGNSDVPGDVADKFALGQAEIAKPSRKLAAKMVAHQ
jgi:hypothetical protein